MADNYKTIKQKLLNREEFNGRSAQGEIIDFIYIVWSYKTQILKFDLVTQEVEFFNDIRYSCTTSKLQNLIREYFNIEEVQK